MKVDVIGDVHGCYDELKALLSKLGYQKVKNRYVHPDHRRLVFVGDITDRGPDSISTIKLVHQLVLIDQIADYVPGNHCNKLYRYFLGDNVQIRHGLETTVEEYLNLSSQQKKQVKANFVQLYEQAPLYLELKSLNAIIAHAGIKAELIGLNNKKVQSFVLYGDTTGETHADGRPIRRDWAKSYRGDSWIIYGHTPVLEPRLINKTINIDLGCVFGNKLAAFQLPEQTIQFVDSSQPFQPEKFTSFTS